MKGVAEAPGKVIVSGEHFVVHGAEAVAAAIERKVRAEATRSDRLLLSAPVSGPLALGPARKVVESLYASMGAEPRVSISVSSTLAPGAGLGSSAAAMVAVAGAASALEGWGLEGMRLAEAGLVGERLVHGNPSGIDTAASAMGGVIAFRRGEPPRALRLGSPLALLVVYSGARRSTGALIKRVGEERASHPSLFGGLCEGASMVSGLCEDALGDGDARALGLLMTYSHAVLGRVGASTAALDGLVDLCLSLGCLGAKLTGAGGGGSVLAVPPPGRAAAEGVVSKLRSRGYDAFLTRVPAAGARAWRE